jgi:hypothetical protein
LFLKAASCRRAEAGLPSGIWKTQRSAPRSIHFLRDRGLQRAVVPFPIQGSRRGPQCDHSKVRCLSYLEVRAVAGALGDITLLLRWVRPRRRGLVPNLRSTVARLASLTDGCLKILSGPGVWRRGSRPLRAPSAVKCAAGRSAWNCWASVPSGPAALQAYFLEAEATNTAKSTVAEAMAYRAKATARTWRDASTRRTAANLHAPPGGLSLRT